MTDTSRTTGAPGTQGLSEDERAFVRAAAECLENPGVLIRAINLLGKPIELLQNQLPERASTALTKAANFSLEKAFTAALATMPEKRSDPDLSFSERRDRAFTRGGMHTLGTAVVGGVGGFFGIAGLPFELPITTGLMLRSIADIARIYGAKLDTVEDQLECLQVFALGSPSPKDDSTETSYYTARVGMAHLLHEAVAYLSSHSIQQVLKALDKGSAPVLLRFISVVAQRFELSVSEKLLAEAIPVVGAAGGAMLNTIFTSYYNDVATYHFGLRALEKKHGEFLIKQAYRDLGRRQKI